MARVFDRGAIFARRIRRVENYLGSNGAGTRESVTLHPSGDIVEVVFDPSEIVWEDTPGGGREMIRMYVFCEHGAMSIGALFDLDDRRWRVSEVMPGYMFGDKPGDYFTAERIFGFRL